MADKNELLADHYQQTYDLTYKLWEQRNRTFLILIGVIAVATLLTYRPADTNPLLVDWIAKLLGIEDKERIATLHNSFPFALLQGILLTVVFFLMVNLFHRSLYVLRNYAYLGAIEKDIRDALGLSDEASFSRESEFYWKKRPSLLGTVKYFYVFVLGALLSAFLVGKTVGDVINGSWILVLVDGLFVIVIGIYYTGYAWYTLRLDSKDAIVPARAESANNTMDRSGGSTAS
jgi:hypothetical protein